MAIAYTVATLSSSELQGQFSIVLLSASVFLTQARCAHVVLMFPGVCPAAALGVGYSLSSFQLLEDTTSRAWEYESRRVHGLSSQLVC